MKRSPDERSDIRVKTLAYRFAHAGCLLKKIRWAEPLTYEEQ